MISASSTVYPLLYSGPAAGSHTLRYILYMITADKFVLVLYRVHSTHSYRPSAVYTTCDQFTVDPLLVEITHEFVLDPLYQLPKTQFQPEAPLRKITT